MSWLCLVLWALAIIVIPAAAVPVATRNARASRGRWGDRLVVHEAESGPYREGFATERIPRGAPASVWATAIAAPLWASVTLLVCCPTGALFVLTGGEALCMRGWEDTPPCEVPSALHVTSAVVAAVLVCSGLVLGVRLIRDSIALPAAGAPELRANRVTAVLGAVHHAVVLAWWLTILHLHAELDSFPWVTTASCALGVLLALTHWRASSHVARSLASARAQRP